MPSTTIQYFAYAHLPARLQTVSGPIAELAHQMEAMLPDGPEKSAGMRKLLEAKDCFVRAALPAPEHPEAQAIRAAVKDCFVGSVPRSAPEAVWPLGPLPTLNPMDPRSTK